jgi:hypothetical protein
MSFIMGADGAPARLRIGTGDARGDIVMGVPAGASPSTPPAALR